LRPFDRLRASCGLYSCALRGFPMRWNYNCVWASSL